MDIKCGLLGKSLKHSYSELIHRYLGDYPYTLIELFSEEQVYEFLGNTDLTGFNVTIPYKSTTIPYMDELSEEAKAVGAVNTVIKKDGIFCGYNTDVQGFIKAVHYAGIEMQNKNVLILGTGGASKAVVYALDKLKAKSVHTVSRSGAVNYLNADSLFPDTQVLINATPVGMYPDSYACPIDIHRFPKLTAVIDLIYNPCKTKLLIDAQLYDLQTLNGLPMLVFQGELSSQLFGNAQKSENDLIKYIREIETSNRNIVFIGMPGSGKSTLGKEIALSTNRQFVDTDTEIEKLYGMSVPQIFDQYGEDIFRKSESDAIAKYAKEHSLVISVGGGALMNEENAYRLKCNGFLVYIERDIDRLAIENRPLSQTIPPEKLFKERYPIYRKWADITIDNNTTIENALNDIKKEILQ